MANCGLRFAVSHEKPDAKGRTIRKVMGGEGNFRAAGIFFSSSNSLYEFFLGYSMNIFLGLIGVQEFFSFNFPLREFFFGTSPPPPPSISFLMVRP